LHRVYTIKQILEQQEDKFYEVQRPKDAIVSVDTTTHTFHNKRQGKEDG